MAFEHHGQKVFRVHGPLERRGGVWWAESGRRVWGMIYVAFHCV